jgi:hypothetical protein
MATEGYQGPGNITASPLYQWQLEQGTEGINRAAAARGGYGSTAAVSQIGDFTRALGAQETETQYNRGLTEYNTQYDRLMNLVNVGRGATTESVSAGQAAASNIGNITTAGGTNLANLQMASGANPGQHVCQPRGTADAGVEHLQHDAATDNECAVCLLCCAISV